MRTKKRYEMTLIEIEKRNSIAEKVSNYQVGPLHKKFLKIKIEETKLQKQWRASQRKTPKFPSKSELFALKPQKQTHTQNSNKNKALWARNTYNNQHSPGMLRVFRFKIRTKKGKYSRVIWPAGCKWEGSRFPWRGSRHSWPSRFLELTKRRK